MQGQIRMILFMAKPDIRLNALKTALLEHNAAATVDR